MPIIYRKHPALWVLLVFEPSIHPSKYADSNSALDNIAAHGQADDILSLFIHHAPRDIKPCWKLSFFFLIIASSSSSSSSYEFSTL